MGTIISKGQCYASTRNCRSIHLSNASLRLIRAGTRYKLSKGTEQEARPCSEMHTGPSQPRGWFLRASGARFNFHTSSSHQYLELLVIHPLSPVEGLPSEYCSLLLLERTELSHHSLHGCHSSLGS